MSVDNAIFTPVKSKRTFEEVSSKIKNLIFDGTLKPAVETPERADIILARVNEVGLGEVLAPEDFGIEPLGRVHDNRYLMFLETAWGL